MNVYTLSTHKAHTLSLPNDPYDDGLVTQIQYDSAITRNEAGQYVGRYAAIKWWKSYCEACHKAHKRGEEWPDPSNF